MATIKQVSVHVERTISKNYNSTKYGFGMVLDVEDGEDTDLVYSECTQSLKEQIRRAYNASNGETASDAPLPAKPETWPAIR